MKKIKYFKFFEDFDNTKFKIPRLDLGIYSYPSEEVKIEDLIGKIIINIKYTDNTLALECVDSSDDEIFYEFYHEQDCTEDVWLDDIVGDLSDLLMYPVLKAEEKVDTDSSMGIKTPNRELDTSSTWTFYTIATFNGYVDFRWCGTSNGYYSEKVTIHKYIIKD